MPTLCTTSTFPANLLKLENGLTIIHQYTPATPAVVVDVWVRAGAIQEPEQWSGMAHFLEHMIFKGTDQVAPGVFDQIIENLGGVTNAATSHDYAHFFLTTASQYLPESLPLLGELLLNATIPDDEFGRERDVVLEELRQSEDSPDWIGFQALVESLYPRHPYGRSVLGTESLLREYTPEQMRSFHRSYYQPENMTVVMVGGIEKSAALDLAGETFGSFPQRSDCPLPQIQVEPPLTGIRRQSLSVPRLEQARLMMAWAGPGVEGLRDAYGLDLLSVLLGEGRTSRLVRELREERGLVQMVGSGFSLQRESSLLTITAMLDAEHLDRVEAIICDRISELATQPISEIELARCKRLLCNDYAFSTETPGQLAGLYGYYFTVARPEFSVMYPEYIQSFRPEELQQLAQKYLSPYRYAVTILKALDS